MRKRNKLKKRSCKMCKPHKMKISNRWKVKDFDSLSRSEKEIQETLKGGNYVE